MKYEFTCSVCGRHSTNPLNFRCPTCNRALDTQLLFDFEIKKVRRKNYDVWRYENFFPYVKKNEIITLGEGWTPLIKFSRNVFFKLENLNPTGSFKDRGSTVLVSTLHKLIRKAEGFLAEDSSGNAGASVAAYAARAGLRAKIYVPENVSGAKFSQIQAYGAEIVKVSGSRSEVAEKAQKPENKKFYVGHILHPLFRDGIRSLAYEIAEQRNWRVEERIYLPVSAGTLLLGMISGFRHLVKSNVIEAMPKIVACQTHQVSPLHHRFRSLIYKPPEKIVSIADALVSVNPPLLDLMVKGLRESRGESVIVEENEIFSAFKELGRKGFYVEPSSAVAYAAYKKQLKNKEIRKENKVLIILTGSGLKTCLPT